jgi:hypothetical protein
MINNHFMGPQYIRQVVVNQAKILKKPLWIYVPLMDPGHHRSRRDAARATLSMKSSQPYPHTQKHATSDKYHRTKAQSVDSGDRIELVCCLPGWFVRGLMASLGGLMGKPDIFRELAERLEKERSREEEEFTIRMSIKNTDPPVAATVLVDKFICALRARDGPSY